MPWDPTKPAGGDAGSSIDDSIIANNQALDTWGSSFSAGIGSGAVSYLKVGTTVASAGVFRLANTGAINWRNAANSADKGINLNASDYLEINADAVVPLTDAAFELGGTSKRWLSLFLSSVLQMWERADPSAPASNSVYLYAKDNGSGKTQIVALFPTGAVQILATEP